jgi:catechol 2,3-dioxygenase-like lactoylglutathione lyase family enzyme
MSSDVVGLDHLVIVATDVRSTVSFYIHVLGAEVSNLTEWERGDAEYPTLHFGAWKINVHPADTDAAPRALHPVPGSADLCVEWRGSISEAHAHLRAADIDVEYGPVDQHGARGWGRSLYFRDPDGCLLELISYSEERPRPA